MTSEFEHIDWNLVSDLKASERRPQVLHALCEKPRTSSELSEKLGISTKWARQQINWLRRRGLVEELTEEKPNYKLFRATKKGQRIVEVL